MANTKIPVELSSTPGIVDNSNATAITIDSSENVGIGTTSPARQLHVNSGTSNVVARFESTDSRAVAEFKDPSGTAELGNIGNDIYFAPAGSEKVRIDSSGKVGIGTASGTGSLHVTTKDSNGSDVYYVAQNTTSNRLAGYKIFDESGNTGGVFQYDNGGNALNIGTAINTHFSFITNNTERMRIDSSGDVHVNCTSTAGAGSSTTGVTLGANSGGLVTIHRSGATALFVGRSDDGEVVALYSGTSQKGVISISGSTTTYGSVSDERLKDITGKARGLEVINKLNPVSFTWKEDGKNSEGLIAQEVQKLYPDAVAKMEGKDISEEEKYLTLDYGKLVTPLIKAIQEQQTQIEALQSEINLLKGE